MMVLDLFCGGVGASWGYHQAGFEVIGVDKPMNPHYPFEFVQDDAMDVLKSFSRRHTAYRGKKVDLIHLSPPWMPRTREKRAQEAPRRRKDEPNLLAPSLRLLEDVRTPWVVGSVPGAPMPKELMLCGSMFGLEVFQHLWFCAHRDLVLYPPGVCDHKPMAEPTTPDPAIPPAYTKFIGGILMRQLLP